MNRVLKRVQGIEGRRIGAGFTDEARQGLRILAFLYRRHGFHQTRDTVYAFCAELAPGFTIQSIEARKFLILQLKLYCLAHGVKPGELDRIFPEGQRSSEINRCKYEWLKDEESFTLEQIMLAYVIVGEHDPDAAQVLIERSGALDELSLTEIDMVDPNYPFVDIELAFERLRSVLNPPRHPRFHPKSGTMWSSGILSAIRERMPA